MKKRFLRFQWRGMSRLISPIIAINTFSLWETGHAPSLQIAQWIHKSVSANEFYASMIRKKSLSNLCYHQLIIYICIREAEEKCGALKLFLATRKLVILFKSKNGVSINLFHANDLGSGVWAYLLTPWVYQCLLSDKYEFYVRLLFRKDKGGIINFKSEEDMNTPSEKMLKEAARWFSKHNKK